MVTFLAVLLTVYTFRNLLGLLAYAITLRTSTREKHVQKPNFSSRAIGILNFEKTFSKSYRRHYELISKFNVGLKTLLREGLSEPEFLAHLSRRLKDELIECPSSLSSSLSSSSFTLFKDLLL